MAIVRSITGSITGSISFSLTVEDASSSITLLSGVFTVEDRVTFSLTGDGIGAQWVWSGGPNQSGNDFVADSEVGQTILLLVADPAAITGMTLTDGGIDGALPDFSLLPALVNFSGSGNAFDGTIPTLPDTLEGFRAANSALTDNIPDLSNTALSVFDVTNCSLTGVAVGFAVPNTVEDFLASGNDLTEAAVDAILAACVAAGLTNATIALEGNAAPSAAGLADKATLEGDGCTVTVTVGEFITNGGFASNANWTEGTGWVIAAGVATYTTGGGVLSQNFGSLVAPLTNGVEYTLSFDLTNINGGIVAALLTGGTGSQTAYNSTGTGAGRTANFTATDARTTISFQSVDDEPIVIDNVSLVPA